MTDIIIMCSAVNSVDLSALESLEAINERLELSGVRFHLSEVKGPVMDLLVGTDFLKFLNGRVFLSQHLAHSLLTSEDKTELSV